jgi:hypothetical protein
MSMHLSTVLMALSSCGCRRLLKFGDLVVLAETSSLSLASLESDSSPEVAQHISSTLRALEPRSITTVTI